MTKAYISDVHSNIEALEAVLADIKSKGITEIIFLGDLYGYGPNPNEVTDVAMDSDWKIHSGNHDKITAKTAETRKKGEAVGKIEQSMGDVAYDAMDAQIGMMFTDNPHEYLSTDYAAKLIGASNVKLPSGMIGRIRTATDSAIDNAVMGLFGITSVNTAKRKLKLEVGKAIQQNVPGLLFTEAFKFMEMNKGIYEKIKEQETAIARYKFMQELAGTPNYANRDERHCFHCPEWGDRVFAYLLDDTQKEIREKEGLSAILDAYTIDDAMAAAKRAIPRGGKIVMLHGHDHIQNVTTVEDAGVELTLISLGTVGCPRLKADYDSGTYVIEHDDGSFTKERAQYDWEATYNKLNEKSMPQNKVWKEMKK